MTSTWPAFPVPHGNAVADRAQGRTGGRMCHNFDSRQCSAGDRKRVRSATCHRLPETQATYYAKIIPALSSFR